ncbi:MAG: hypothetical protein K9N23_11695 [Akkermansiaceae bacterium]|nr:hypothetical protein [Akkermansiaceae bacterium]
MKRVLLICPDQRPALESLTGGVPLALAAYLGKPLIEHALDGLVRQGATHVRILASDRPSEVRAYVMQGTAWGLEVEVSPEASELTPAAAAAKHAAFQPDATLTLDNLPQAPEVSILTDAATWHQSRTNLLPLLAGQQIGAREIAPGIWLGLRARVDPSAKLSAPCWIGPNSIVGADATIGPGAYVESDSLVDAHATVEQSTVAPRTYLGSMTQLTGSIAAGSMLTNWGNGSQVRLTDAFLLSPLDLPHEAASNVPARLLAGVLLLLGSPVLIVAGMVSLVRRQPLWRRQEAALPTDAGTPQRTIAYHVLPSLPGWLGRWPMLWRIVTGHFAWTGNPPLTPAEAALLEGEFERLWLHSAPGLFTAPEAEGCHAPWDDAARAHAALFACQPTVGWRWKIIRRGLTNLKPSPIS